MKDLRVIERIGVAVVTAHDDYNPMRHLKKISSELKDLKYRGAVVFDLLSCNGLSSNRFIKIIFDGFEFDRSSFDVVRDIDKSIKQEQDDFFRSDPELLHSTVLSRSEIKKFCSHAA